MAEHLASIFGTEKDRVNCPFYFKIGACRHGDRCSRLHTKPSVSPTLLLSNMYQRPDMITPGVDAQGNPIDPRRIQQHFEEFYEDLFEELIKYGEIESLNVCDNLADHMVGNVYVQFREEEHASNALKNLTGRFYAGRPIIVDFSPVTDFREATCRQYEENACNRGGYCNFMHLKRIGRELRRQLFGSYRRRHSHSRSRSRSPYRHRSHEEHSHSGRGSGRRYDDREHYYESHSRRHRSTSPGHRKGRSRSPGGRRKRSPVREGSEERRAKIAQWNREREQQEETANNNVNADSSNNDNGQMQNGSGVNVDGIYALAQCWDSVGREGCRGCLEVAGKAARGCVPKKEGRGMNAGCYLRYSTDKFYNNGGGDERNAPGFSGPGIAIAVVLAAAACLMLSIFAAYASYVRLLKAKRERNNLGKVPFSFNKSSLNFKYEILEKATDFFSPSRKLGQGGAGSVFIGTLPNGETVAVKRLIFNTRQWVDEFFNEVNLISGIQHKNLVKLLGCSIEGPESLLVYEYVRNKSLDQFLFDKTRSGTLNWKQRFEIILGTAEGLAYLHGGSQVRIIHRDIKSSNVLLDDNLTPKIADFGLVRCFGADKSHLSTGIAGTIGYMAPEYLIRGQLTDKADVYSFGVLVLEILGGKRCNAFVENSGSLLQTVWRLYRSNRLVDAVDPCLRDEFPTGEATCVLQIGLLCTQASAALRPSMAQVVHFLTNNDCEIPPPNQPPYMNTSLLETENSRRSYSINSLVSNGPTEVEASSTSMESSSIHSSEAK